MKEHRKAEANRVRGNVFPVAPLATSLLTTLLLMSTTTAIPAPLMNAAGGKPNRDEFIAKWGVRLEDYRYQFGADGVLQVDSVGCSVPCAIAYPGEKLTVEVQFRNLTGEALPVRGRWLLIDEDLVTRSDDVFDLGIVVHSTTPFGKEVSLDLPAKGSATVETDVPLSERFGSAALFFVRTDTGTRLLVGHYARTLDPDVAPGQADYQLCMDISEGPLIARLKTAPNRIGVPYTPFDDPGCERSYERVAQELDAIQAAGYPVCVEFGGGPDHGAYMPLGRTRPHLTDDGVMLETKSDFAWLPSYDADFKARVKWLVATYGYPKGPVNALMLWNEPWNGMSISGWGADDFRYREIYTAMCEGAEEAMRENPGIKVLLGGCDSSNNTYDKFFSDGTDTFLKRLDFLSLHYQGLGPTNPRMLRDRKHANGRTRFWDTESWVANSGDRVPGVIAGMLAAGHDRLVGIQAHGVVASGFDVQRVDAEGKNLDRVRQYRAWPVAPALCAFQHFVGNRRFEAIEWQGLPWVYRFRGERAEDLTYIVCGDIAPVFDGKRDGVVPFWTVRNHEGVHGTMTLTGARAFSLYDGNGNLVAGGEDTLVVPLTDKSYYLKADGSAGSAEALRKAVAMARIEGLAAVAPALRDATAPIGSGAVFGAELRNLLNRDIRGTLAVEAEGLVLEVPGEVAIPAHGTVEIPLKVVSGKAAADNTYAFRLRFDAGADGVVQWLENLHCNVIARGRPGFEGPYAQPTAASATGATLMERAWLPMLKLDAENTPAGGAALAWLGADDDFFYFAAKIADTTPDEGMMRFETRDEEADFYPDEVVQYDTEKTVAMVERDGAWSTLVDKMAFTVEAPVGGARVALRLLDNDGLARRHYSITVGEGRPFEARPQMEHTWLRFNVPEGKVRVEIATRNWLKPALLAVAMDPVEEELAREAMEFDKGQGFEKVYGSLMLVTPKDAAGLEWERNVAEIRYQWPEGVRHYSYRRRPDLPQGMNPAHDNVQIAFNVLPDDAKPWYPSAPGAFKGYSTYWDTDYEFALNPVAEAYGGGTEIWKCLAPYLPDKHYYPHSPKHPREGAVKGAATLSIRRDAAFRYVELALPWSEIPEVKAARDAGRTIKFSYRVNDNSGRAGCMELAYGRSVSKRNGPAFRPGWVEHWANEVVFGWDNGEPISPYPSAPPLDNSMTR